MAVERVSGAAADVVHEIRYKGDVADNFFAHTCIGSVQRALTDHLVSVRAVDVSDHGGRAPDDANPLRR